jgi:hypothetical protein
MKKYFYTDGEEQFGPFSINELKNIKISRDYYVWFEGLSEWKLIAEVDELKEIFTSIPPPIASIKKNDAELKESSSEFNPIETNNETTLILINDSVDELISKTFSSENYHDQRGVSLTIILVFENSDKNKLIEYFKKLSQVNYKFLVDFNKDSNGMIFDKYPFLRKHNKQNTNKSSFSGAINNFFKNINGTQLLIYNLCAYVITFCLGYILGLAYGLSYITITFLLLTDLIIGGLGIWYRSKQFIYGIYFFLTWVTGVVILDLAEFGKYLPSLNNISDTKFIGYILAMPVVWYFILANKNK